MGSNTELKLLRIDGHEMFYRKDILENPEPLSGDMIAFYHGVKDLYQVKRESDYGQILIRRLKAAASLECAPVIKRVAELEAALQRVVDCHYCSNQGILPKSRIDKIEKLLAEGL
jgi:hypothetical protein